MCLIICVYARLWGSWQNLQGRVINQLYSSACNTFHCKKPQMPLPSGNLSACHTEGFSPTESPARQTLKTAGFHILWAPLPQRAGALHFTCDSLGEQGPFSPPPPCLFLPLLAFWLEGLFLESAGAHSMLALLSCLCHPQ